MQIFQHMHRNAKHSRVDACSQQNMTTTASTAHIFPLGHICEVIAIRFRHTFEFALLTAAPPHIPTWHIFRKGVMTSSLHLREWKISRPLTDTGQWSGLVNLSFHSLASIKSIIQRTLPATTGGWLLSCIMTVPSTLLRAGVCCSLRCCCPRS